MFSCRRGNTWTVSNAPGTPRLAQFGNAPHRQYLAVISQAQHAETHFKSSLPLPRYFMPSVLYVKSENTTTFWCSARRERSSTQRNYPIWEGVSLLYTIQRLDVSILFSSFHYRCEYSVRCESALARQPSARCAAWYLDIKPSRLSIVVL